MRGVSFIVSAAVFGATVSALRLLARARAAA